MTVPRERVARAFGAAHDYDGQARVQRVVAHGLAARIAALDIPADGRVLEIGCGTGFLTGALHAAGIAPAGHWTISDLSPAMVERCRARIGEAPGRHFAALDGEYGTVRGGPFSLICSSLAVQWFDDAPRALARMAQWLAPGGHLVVATLGPGSFAEWRAAHAALDLAPGTPDFAPASAFEALRPAALDVERHVEHHGDARDFLHAVKGIGAGSARAGRRPLTPAQLRAVMAQFDRSGSEVTYEVVTCHLHRAR